MINCSNIWPAVLSMGLSAISAIGGENRIPEAVDYKSFHKMESYYDSMNGCVVIYLWSGNSSLVFSNIHTEKRQRGAGAVYEFTVLASYGGGKEAAMFRRCLDGGYLVSFPVKNFRSGRDKVVYFEGRGNAHEIPFLGGREEALFNHKLLPPNWQPPPVKGIPGLPE